jgi:glycosyltransferase involved in cell wall biosynthesis
VTRVSLIATVRNEAASLADWLAGIDAQHRPPDEVVIVDGGSADGTWEALQAWGAGREGALCLRCAGANIAQGRNRAIERATGAIVVVTDAGTRAAPDWLQQFVGALDDPTVDVAGGFFVPRLATRWDRALAATTLPDVGEIDAGSFLPSSRSIAFRRSWFDAGVRYPEWLDYCEDVVWDLALRRAGARFRFVPDAVVTFSVRPTPRSHAAQYFRYARGDGKAGLFARRHLLRYATYVALALVLQRKRWSELAAGGLLGLAYIGRPMRRLWQRDRLQDRSIAATLLLLPALPLLRFLGDLSKMAGYPAGLAWRWRRYGSIGWRTSWRRISPAGCLWRPGAQSRGNLPPTSSRGA